MPITQMLLNGTVTTDFPLTDPKIQWYLDLPSLPSGNYLFGSNSQIYSSNSVYGDAGATNTWLVGNTSSTVAFNQYTGPQTGVTRNRMSMSDGFEGLRTSVSSYNRSEIVASGGYTYWLVYAGSLNSSYIYHQIFNYDGTGYLDSNTSVSNTNYSNTVGYAASYWNQGYHSTYHNSNTADATLTLLSNGGNFQQGANYVNFVVYTMNCPIGSVPNTATQYISVYSSRYNISTNTSAQGAALRTPTVTPTTMVELNNTANAYPTFHPTYAQSIHISSYPSSLYLMHAGWMNRPASNTEMVTLHDWLLTKVL